MSKLIERNLGDENFAHCIGLIGPMAAWAEALEPGHVITDDDLNMVQLPVEVALAFIKEGDFPDAQAKCFEVLGLFRAARFPKKKPSRPNGKKDRAARKAAKADLLTPTQDARP